MRKKGDIFEYQRQRDEAIIAAYRKAIDCAKGQVVLPEIAAHIASQPSPRFWVTPERAHCVISHMIRGGSIESLRPNKKAMFFEILKRVTLLLLKPEYKGTPLSHIVQLVVESEAPSFYLTEKSVIVMLHRAKKRLKCKR